MQVRVRLCVAASRLSHQVFHHVKVLWRWGVVTSYLLDLEEIDSIGAFGNDVMELVTDVRARRGARIMLLDDFMQAPPCMYHAYAMRLLYLTRLPCIPCV